MQHVVYTLMTVDTCDDTHTHTHAHMHTCLYTNKHTLSLSLHT
jgi:hypothetical protein